MFKASFKQFGKWKATISWTHFVYFSFILFCCNERSFVLADGNIGCLFAEDVCILDDEWCFDDFIFGKCLPIDGLEPEELDRKPIPEDAARALAVMLEDFQGAELDWNDLYVQCRLQGALYSIRQNVPLPSDLCSDLVPPHKKLHFQSPIAIVQFTPPGNTYADEVYYPPMKKGLGFRNFDSDTDLRKSKKDSKHMYQTEPEADEQNSLASRVKDIKNRIELRRMLSEYEAGQLKPPIYYKDNIVDPDDFYVDDTDEELSPYSQRNDKRQFLKPELSNNYYPVRLSDLNLNRNNQEEDYLEDDSRSPYFIAKDRNDIDLPESGVYTEGGLIYGNASPQQKASNEPRFFLENYLAFTRRERLDVKKPGPPAEPPPYGHQPNKTPDLIKTQVANLLETQLHDAKDKEFLPKIKKDVSEDSINECGQNNCVYLFLNKEVDNFTEGARIVDGIENALGMKGSLKPIRVERAEIVFSVNDTNGRRTAHDVARLINVKRIGPVRIPAIKEAKVEDNPRMEKLKGNLIYIILVAVGAAALLVSAITLMVRKRYDKNRDKLGDLQSSLSGPAETCKDYQDLCRARMTGKGSTSEPPNSGGRVVILNQENDRPPSSRSSTSSWSEEPALTNMDISTGHMVLSYMEDHLRNKGRLQREWEVLCRYEAEPSARDAALQSQCASLNRLGAPLPYDHSRVVLNHLANAEGLDYINASTITDHDPRAPAYVAAQGPLPTTLAHFWQMIWEQGAVVIVALCRLQENNESACARYWPEEGAEIYHIYEVHLVSEHIWCDDYLVRSFYLKNLRTGETRTVTQFHFLSWPQTGVPTQAKALLEFRRKVNKSYRGRSCPIVVHSSHGAGRTGAYILLDLVLARMNKGAREIDIAATLEHLRDQRAGLVATRQQFEFVLMAVAEEVHAILKALPANTQGEKRELDKETVKEHEGENVEKPKEKQKESEDKDDGKDTKENK